MGHLSGFPKDFARFIYPFRTTMRRRENAERKSADYTYIWERQTEGDAANNGEVVTGKTCL